jgi:hypothetical protein
MAGEADLRSIASGAQMRARSPPPARSRAGALPVCRVHYARAVMRATMYYSLLRVLLFLAVAVLLALFGVHGITLLAVALIISAILSLVFLSKLRDRMSAALTRRVDSFRARLDEGTRGEDVD